MLNSSRENLEEAKRFARVFLNDTNTWALEVRKPIFLEEFGMARNNWENVGKGYPYLSSAGTSNKDEYFETVIGEVAKCFKSDEDKGAYVGSCPWTYGGLWRPETEKVNEWGTVWAGDPPHESPGWYDVYDTDETMGVIEAQQREVVEYSRRQGNDHWLSVVW
jgi:mannan endo-1,4-beta-mannosidase